MKTQYYIQTPNGKLFSFFWNNYPAEFITPTKETQEEFEQRKLTGKPNQRFKPKEIFPKDRHGSFEMYATHEEAEQRMQFIKNCATQEFRVPDNVKTAYLEYISKFKIKTYQS